MGFTRMVRKFRYKRYLNGNKWDAKRKAVLARDGYMCQRCGASNTMLHVHHLTYNRIFRERLGDLQTLCAGCHRANHQL